MGEDINQYIESKIIKSLSVNSPQGFTEKLIKEIELSKEFAKQDKKTSRLAIFAFGVVAFLFVSFAGLLAFYLSNQIASGDSDAGIEINSFTAFLNETGYKILSFFGLTSSLDSFIYILLGVMMIGMFSVADKFIFKRST